MLKADKLNTIENEYITVYLAEKVWSAPDNEGLSRWRLIIGSGDELMWAYTYNPELAKVGTHNTIFYRDTSMRPCIRVPKK